MRFTSRLLWSTLVISLLVVTQLSCTPDSPTLNCEPACEGRTCGDDGCGGQCGSCEGGGTCDADAGQCVCNLDALPCGGACPSGERCDAVTDTCVTCTPSCEGRACGDDGCGGVCGPGCALGQQCDVDTGQCGRSAYGQGHWRFEEQNGPSVLDSGPHGLDGTVNDRPTRTTDRPVASIPISNMANAQALDLGWSDPATGGFFVVNERDLLLSMGTFDFTIEAWVKLDVLSDTSDGNQRQVLCQKKRESEPDTRTDYMVLVQRGGLAPEPNYGKSSGHSGRELQIVFGTGESLWGVTSNLEIGDTAWHFVSVAVDAAGQQVRFGLDDSFETIPFDDNQRVVNDGPLRVGSHETEDGAANHFLRGSIDELRVSQEFLAPDELLSAAMPDCNNNRVWDALDIAADSADCNHNDIPDECDVNAGDSADCQADGVPDECQLTERVELAHHEATGSLAWRSDHRYTAWLTRFNVQRGARILDAFDVDIGSLPVGTEVNVHVWSDPNGDGSPADAQLLWSGAVTTEEDVRTLAVDVPELDVGSTGASFFVGCVLPNPPSTDDFPAQFDITGEPVRGRSWGVGSDTAIDPANLSRNADEFGPLEDLLFAGTWVMRAYTYAPANDCNGNARPDDCDVRATAGLDADCSRQPDACEDCNGNGALDRGEVMSGVSPDTNADGIPDTCQLAGNDCNADGIPDDTQRALQRDCNGNAILDSCDVSSRYSSDADQSGVPDECEDCNGNGVLDSSDIAGGDSTDCDGNGVPDACELGRPLTTLTYSHDDGSRESQAVFTPPVVELAWLHHHTVQAGGEWISAISVVWGETYPGLPARVLLWSDPNGDGDPSDAQLLREVTTETKNVNAMVWNTVAIPPTWVGPAGTSFFVGVYFDDIYGTRAVAVDANSGAGASWVALAYDPAVLDLSNLNPGLVGTALLPYPTLNFFIRAEASDGVLEQDCNASGVPDVCEPEACSSR